MKKYSIILWAILLFIAFIIAFIVLVPTLFKAWISVSLFWAFVKFIGKVFQFFLVFFIVICILIYIFSK